MTSTVPRSSSPRLQQIVSQQDSSLTLSAFIVANTPFASLGWSRDGTERMSKSDVENLGILFQVDDEAIYIDTMIKQLTADALRTP